MGKQVRFDFDEKDEQLLVEHLQKAEPWLVVPSPTPAGAKWRPLESRGNAVDLLLCPGHLIDQLEGQNLSDLDVIAGRVLVWSRSPSSGSGSTDVEIATARIWLDTIRAATEPSVKKAYAGLARLITSHSPRFASAGGAPIYIGPHLASQFESGALRARWPNGELAKLRPNPRLKKAGARIAKRTSRPPRSTQPS